MVKSTVKVVLRARPANTESQSFTTEDKVVTVRQRNARDKGCLQFRFNSLLSDANQKETYKVCADDIVRSVTDGFNGTILAYGQTGAGKTYTMTGRGAAYENRGITPRAISEIFRSLREDRQSSSTVRVAYIEIYNESIYDLLLPSADPSGIAVVEGAKGSVQLRGVQHRLVANEDEALEALFEGETARAIAEHQMNKHSSRSHTVFTIHIESRPDPESEEATFSKLHLVDLAGSERIQKTGSTGQVLREAVHINKSLAFLEQVVVALSERNRDHVPYRSSKLTHLLKDSLGGNCKTLMIANVWADPEHVDETISTCRFAQRMSCVANEAVVNVKQDSEKLVRELKREVEDLKAELAMHDQFASRSGVSYAPYSDSQRLLLRRQVESFFLSAEPDNSVAPLELPSLRHVKEILLQCKALYNGKSGAGGARSRVQKSASGDLHEGCGPLRPEAGGDEEAECVGELEDEGPTKGIPAAPPDPTVLGAAASGGLCGQSQTPTRREPPPESREEAFEAFKEGPGKEVAGALVENRRTLRAARQRQKEISLGVNATKREIDSARDDAERELGSGSAQEPGEELRDRAVARLRGLKAHYREQYKELQMVKSEVEYTAKLVEACTRELSAAFQEWLEAESAPQHASGVGRGRAPTFGGGEQSEARGSDCAVPLNGPGSAGPYTPGSPMQELWDIPERGAWKASAARSAAPSRGVKAPTRNRAKGTFGTSPRLS